jgi:hypothetical protein
MGVTPDFSLRLAHEQADPQRASLPETSSAAEAAFRVAAAAALAHWLNRNHDAAVNPAPRRSRRVHDRDASLGLDADFTWLVPSSIRFFLRIR